MECVVALPGQLFTNTQIPACIWVLTPSKAARNGSRNRVGETLFIDARNFGYMKSRVLREFGGEDIRKIGDTFLAWKKGESYSDNPGFCKAAALADIHKHEYVLTPGRYVGAAAPTGDGVPFEERMGQLTAQLNEQVAESAKLDKVIRTNLARLGYDG